MDNNNTNGIKPNQRSSLHESHTTPPHWHCTSYSKVSASQGSSRKFYILLISWLVVLSMAVAASISSDQRESKGKAVVGSMGENAFTRHDTDYNDASAQGEQLAQRPNVTLLNEPSNSTPASFRDCQDNSIDQPQFLQTASFILADGQRPLRVLHIGDSHVAGKTFPLAVKQTLTHCLGEAESADFGRGVYFSFIGKNGATSTQLNTEDYMAAFSEKHPDLIIVSLGTNEAHGMGYNEAQHEKQLDAFFDNLQTACPDAAILLTTPPGDYLNTSYISYRSSSRSRRRASRVRTTKRINPMSSRCASFIADYGHGRHMAVWDLFTICGGEDTAQRNWATNNYMRPDRVHFQPDGYEIQGHMLGEALVRALAPSD